jgi:hypothetical protein
MIQSKCHAKSIQSKYHAKRKEANTVPKTGGKRHARK